MKTTRNLFCITSKAIAASALAAFMLTGCGGYYSGSYGYYSNAGTNNYNTSTSNTSNYNKGNYSTSTSTSTNKVSTKVNTSTNTNTSNTSTNKNTSSAGSSTTYTTAESIRKSQLTAINTARSKIGKSTLTENSQLNKAAAEIANAYVSYATGEIDDDGWLRALGSIFSKYENLTINCQTIEFEDVTINKYIPSTVKSWNYSGDEEEITCSGKYVGNAIVKLGSYYCGAVVVGLPKNTQTQDTTQDKTQNTTQDKTQDTTQEQTQTSKVIWTGSTNSDGTVTLTGYDKSGATPTGSITLPTTLGGKQVTKLGTMFLWKCNTITEVTIPGSIKTIDYSAFSECKNLRKVTVNEGVNYINSFAFQYCTSLQTVSLPASSLNNNSNGVSIFEDCTSLKQINYPSINRIGKSTFSGCTSLKRIYIPKSVTTINTNAFNKCTSLTDVYYAGSASDWAKVTIESGNGYLLNATIHYNSSRL